MDRFTPVAPARIRSIVLPAGPIERPRFLDLLNRLRKEASIVRLADIDAGDDSQYLLSPKAFPQGSLLFNYVTSPPTEQQQQLSPFELFREPLLAIGIIDGATETTERELERAAAYLREQHPRVVHRQLLIVDDAECAALAGRDCVLRVPKATMKDDVSLRLALLEVARRFLVELITYTKAMQASPSIPTPGQTARNLQRAMSFRDEDRRPASASGYSTPPQAPETLSPVGGDSPARHPLRTFGSPPPATSFDQIPAASGVLSTITRSDSRTSSKAKNGHRASSQDRVSLQGFGSGTSKEKLQQRGKARVGIVLGHIQMMSGQWTEALRTLGEHTAKARGLGDNIWQAKGLEGAVVSLLLLNWAGLDVQIPSVCLPPADRSSSGSIQRSSINLPMDFRPGDAPQATVRKLSSTLPELLNRGLGLYRSFEGSLELPSVVMAEATIRACRLLAALHMGNGDLTDSTLQTIVEGAMQASRQEQKSSKPASTSLKPLIGEMLSLTQVEDSLDASSNVSILAGILSVYDMLGMHRKKAVATKDIVIAMTAALSQARKLGAADAGIHPTASVSAETGAQAILDTVSECGGLQHMLIALYQSFHSDKLRLETLKFLSAWAEAAPDPKSMLLFTSVLLRASSPEAAVDLLVQNLAEPSIQDDHAGLVENIGRTVAMSKHLGMDDIEAEFWDPYLVRGIEFVEPHPSRLLHFRSQISSGPNAAEQSKPFNPLLYDPNAKVQTTDRNKHVLVCNERTTCSVLLQNPLNNSIRIEELSLTTDKDILSLDSNFERVTLGPRCLQQVYISVSPRTPGSWNITGCDIKIAGCRKQFFPIISQAWTATPTFLLKDLSQLDHDTEAAQAPPAATVPIDVIQAQPHLVIESLSSADVSLLEGERRSVGFVVRNTSETAALILDVVGTEGIFELAVSTKGARLEVGDAISLTFMLTGKAGVPKGSAVLYYSVDDDSSVHARALTTAVTLTINAGIEVQHPEIEAVEGADAVLFSFDVGNAWPNLLACSAFNDGDALKTFELGSGKWQRIRMQIDRPPFDERKKGKLDKLRAAFLSRVRVKWRGAPRMHGGVERIGEADLTRLPLTAEMLEVVRGKPVHAAMELVGGEAVAKHSVELGAFVKLRVKVMNRSRVTGLKMVFVQLLSTHSGTSAQPRRVAIAGETSRCVKSLLSDGEAVVEFTICPLMAGKLTLRAVIKPMHKLEEWQCESFLTIAVAVAHSKQRPTNSLRLDGSVVS